MIYITGIWAIIYQAVHADREDTCGSVCNQGGLKSLLSQGCATGLVGLVLTRPLSWPKKAKQLFGACVHGVVCMWAMMYTFAREPCMRRKLPLLHGTSFQNVSKLSCQHVKHAESHSGFCWSFQMSPINCQTWSSLSVSLARRTLSFVLANQIKFSHNSFPAFVSTLYL